MTLYYKANEPKASQRSSNHIIMTNHKHGQVYFQQSSIFYKEQSTLLKKMRSQWEKIILDIYTHMD